MVIIIYLFIYLFYYLINNFNQVPTIVNPGDYKKRFLEEMVKYFIEVSPDI